MKLKSPITTGCLWASAAAFLLIAAAQADTPAFPAGDFTTTQPGTTNPPVSFTGTRGLSFERAGQARDIFITQLGVYDSGGDGLVNPHEVGLWQVNDDNISGTLLASATVPAGTTAPLQDGYRWVSISPVRIPYELGVWVVGAQFSAGDADALVTPQPVYSQIARDIRVDLFGGRINEGPNLAFPSSAIPGPCLECANELFWEPNFQYVYVVPEPSSAWLILLGSGALFYVRRTFHH